MAALGRIMKGVRAHGWMGSAGNVDPAHLLEPFDSSSPCQSYRIVAPGRSRMWRVLLSSLPSVWGPWHMFSSSLKNNIGFCFFISFHLGSITLECASYSWHTEGHLADWVSLVLRCGDQLPPPLSVALITALKFRFTGLVVLPFLATVNHWQCLKLTSSSSS